MLGAVKLERKSPPNVELLETPIWWLSKPKVEAAEAVATLNVETVERPNVLDGLASLVDQSLLKRVEGVGGAFLTVATIAFLLSSPLVGWVLTWIVIALASLNLFAGICVGCLMYYWLNRLGVPGFKYARLEVPHKE